ncbi:MAG: aromatic amino acid ammonia-lyase [Alkalispirochaetaceae bacterium]
MSRSVTVPGRLDLESFISAATGGATLYLRPEASIDSARRFLLDRLSQGEVIYGVNTGFGPLVGRKVANEAAEELQEHLLQQLSPNVGPPVPAAVARGTVALRAAALARGHSGVGSELVSALVDLFNSGATPLLRSYGSVGASGDLVPLARLARVLLGQGEIRLPGGEVRPNSPALLRQLGVSPVQLGAKEALALVNGTSFSAAITAVSLHGALRILADRLLPLSATLLLLMGDSLQHLSEGIYELKAHPSAISILRELRLWLDPLRPEESFGVPQPPYSARSLVLWLGVVRDHFDSAGETIEVEMNSVDDNPLLFPEQERILHGANFQGVYAARAAEEVTGGLAKASVLMERQLNRLFHEHLNGGLPPFLAPEPVGLHSGLQGFQLLATSLLADIRSRALFHGAGSVPTNGDNQDVVSMSANAGANAMEVTRKSSYIASVLECSLARALQLREVELPERLAAWWEKRRFLLEADYAGEPLDQLLEGRKASIIPWDE